MRYKNKNLIRGAALSLALISGINVLAPPLTTYAYTFGNVKDVNKLGDIIWKTMFDVTPSEQQMTSWGTADFKRVFEGQTEESGNMETSDGLDDSNDKKDGMNADGSFPEDNGPYENYLGLVVKSTASTAGSGSNKRYATVAYAVTVGYYTVVVGFDPIYAPGPNGAKQQEANFISKADLIQAAQNQGVPDPKSFARIVLEHKDKDGNPVTTFASAHALFAITRNGTAGINKRYSDGHITYDANGRTLINGKDLEQMLLHGDQNDVNEVLGVTFHDQILTPEMIAAAGNVQPFTFTNNLPGILSNFSAGSQSDIKRNANRQIVPATTGGGTPPIPIPPVPKHGDPGIFTTYHTWDNTTKNRTQTAPYYVTYNDSRTYEDADGHHDVRGKMILPSHGKEFFHPAVSSF